MAHSWVPTAPWLCPRGGRRVPLPAALVAAASPGEGRPLCSGQCTGGRPLPEVTWGCRCCWTRVRASTLNSHPSKPQAAESTLPGIKSGNLTVQKMKDLSKLFLLSTLRTSFPGPGPPYKQGPPKIGSTEPTGISCRSGPSHLTQP